MDEKDNTKQQIVNSSERSFSNISYQLSTVEPTRLGIKCVQAVQSTWKQMCTTVGSAQASFLQPAAMCTNSVQSPIHQQVVHSHFTAVSIRKATGLYTVSTVPTITTKSEYIKRQEPNT